MLTRDQVRLSRRLSMILRHRPEAAGITLDPHGWVPVPMFHRSANGVWLTTAVPPGYLTPVPLP